MELIIKNEISAKEYSLLQILKGEIEEAVPHQSYIRIIYSQPHQLELRITSYSLSWELTHLDESFEALIKGVRNKFRTRIKKWHIERNI